MSVHEFRFRCLECRLPWVLFTSQRPPVRICPYCGGKGRHLTYVTTGYKA